MAGTRTVVVIPVLGTEHVEAQLHVYDGQSHGDFAPTYPAPESLDAQAEIQRFFHKHLKKYASGLKTTIAARMRPPAKVFSHNRVTHWISQIGVVVAYMGDV